MSFGRRVFRWTGRLGAGLLLAGVGSGAYLYVRSNPFNSKLDPGLPPLDDPPPRSEHIRRLRSQQPFDVLVVGGGASGSGVALDATLRGLRVALVERTDFASGTSSRSTKLIHGGVRYLEKAFFQLDPSQLELVFEALHERAIMLRQAEHLTKPLPTILPCYKLFEVPFYWVGLKAYDLVSLVGRGLLTGSRFITAWDSRRLFPTLTAKTPDGDRLRGSIVYFDGQMDDARFNMAIALTSALYGATIANHAEVVTLLKDEKGRIVGANVLDHENGEKFEVRATTVVNATGPFSDSLRHMADEGTNSIIRPSSGVHVTLPGYYSPDSMGLIVPRTKDGRVVFMLPWLDSTIAGTTDSSTEITDTPQPSDQEIDFILDALSDYLTVQVRRKDVKSAWSGIRPLAVRPDAKDGGTQNILRSHMVHVADDGMVTLSGGKWTTYRRMASDTVDALLDAQPDLKKQAGPCRTAMVKLLGSHKWDSDHFTFLVQNYDRVLRPVIQGKSVVMQPARLEVDVARHLSNTYGDQAYKVAQLACEGYGAKLDELYPMLEAEVLYSARHEMCLSATDFLARRTRLAFLDVEASKMALPRIVQLLALELGWSEARKNLERETALKFLSTFEPPPPSTAV